MKCQWDLDISLYFPHWVMLPMFFHLKSNTSFIPVALYTGSTLTDYMKYKTGISLNVYYCPILLFFFFFCRGGVNSWWCRRVCAIVLLSPLDTIEWKLKVREFIILIVLTYPVTVARAKESVTANMFKWRAILNVYSSVKLCLNWPTDWATVWGCVVLGKIFFRPGFSNSLWFSPLYRKLLMWLIYCSCQSV